MLVRIEEIQEGGLELTEELDASMLEETLADSEGFAFEGATALEVSFEKVSGRVHVSGKFEVKVRAPCKRCLKEQALGVPVSFSLRMVHQGRAEEPEESQGARGERPSRRRRRREDDGEGSTAASFELDGIDAEPFDGKTIDLDPIIREQLLLALPVTVLCRDDCRGLCAQCGQDLNERDCGHGGAKDVDGRLAKLKEIKLN